MTLEVGKQSQINPSNVVEENQDKTSSTIINENKKDKVAIDNLGDDENYAQYDNSNMYHHLKQNWYVF